MSMRSALLVSSLLLLVRLLFLVRWLLLSLFPLPTANILHIPLLFPFTIIMPPTEPIARHMRTERLQLYQGKRQHRGETTPVASPSGGRGRYGTCYCSRHYDCDAATDEHTPCSSLEGMKAYVLTQSIRVFWRAHAA